MYDDFLKLTPKRKSILWNYQNDNTAAIIAIKNDALQELEQLFRNTGDNNIQMGSADGMAVTLNATGTTIWENCDGLTTVSEIADILSQDYGVSRADVLEDIKEYLNYCKSLDIIDLNWSSLT